MNNRKPHQRSKFGWSLLAVAVLAAGGWYFGITDRLLPGSAAASNNERAILYTAAVTQAAVESDTWPKSEQDLLREFWKNIALNNIEQAALYCPGSKESDYSAYTRMKTTEQVKLGTPVAHPRAKNVKVWPMQVQFAGIGTKTIKLAITRTHSGQLVIDGQNSIWW